MNRLGLIVGGVLLALMLASSTLFIVDQRQVARRLRARRDQGSDPGAGAQVQAAAAVPERRLPRPAHPDARQPRDRPIFTAEKKSLVIDWLVKWRITDPRQFIRNNGVDMRNLEARLSPIVHAAFNEEITKRTVGERALDRARQGDAGRAQARLADDAKSFGIEILDVRIKRVDFVANITESVYSRMAAERKQVANELRSTGAAEGEKIRADADRQREVIVAEAYRDAQKVKGEGDAKAVGDLRRGVRPRPAVRPVLSQPRGVPGELPQQGDVMVSTRSSDFFKAMRGGAAPPAPAARRRGK